MVGRSVNGICRKARSVFHTYLLGIKCDRSRWGWCGGLSPDSPFSSLLGVSTLKRVGMGCGPWHQAGGKEGRGDGATVALLPVMLAGPVGIIAEAPQRPPRSHHVGTRGEIRAAKGHWAPGFLRTLSWVPQFRERLCQV